MTLHIRPISPAIGAEVIGMDPHASVSDEDFARIRQAWHDHCILVFRDLDMAPEEQIAFSRRFGALHVMTPLEYNLAGYPEIFLVSNVEREGKAVGLKRAGWGWHSDGEDKLVPNAGSLLHARKVPPEGGDTAFANMYRAYDSLSDTMRRRIEGRRGRFSRSEMHHIHYPLMPALTDEDKRNRPDVWHPLVREHPDTGAKSLFIGRWCVEIEGMAHDEGKELIAELTAYAVSAPFVHVHRWSVGDAVLWDNRCTQHCAMPFDDERYERHMHRTTLEGEMPRYSGMTSSVVMPA